jgi:hypothetical protein
MRRLFASIGLAVAVGAIILGLIYSGSPTQARLEKQDQQRIMDLQQIVYSMEAYFISHNKTLPLSLTATSTDAVTPSSFFFRTQDPFTGMPYEYRVTGSSTYELCATFDLASPKNNSPSYARPYPLNESWEHPQGRHCFPLAVPTDRSTPPYPL